MKGKLILSGIIIVSIFILASATANNNVVDLIDDSFRDWYLWVSQDEVVGVDHVNKFGRSTNVDDGISTDIWDGANANDDDDEWNKPTQSRYHQINSTNAGDTNGGAGARNVIIYGLPEWNQTEVSETITLNGVTPVNTSRSYVIIHRMKVNSSGGTNINMGDIRAVADVDMTLTAQVLVGEGQTQMAVYGVPDGQTAYLQSFYTSLLKQTQVNTPSYLDINLLYNPEPETSNNWIVKHTYGLSSAGTSSYNHKYDYPPKFEGSGIFKLQVVGSANDLDVSGGFDLILIDD